MPTELYEIVETKDGEYALRRVDSDESPLVTIRFSAQAIEFLNEARNDVAKTMIEAGIHLVEEMIEEDMQDAEQDDLLDLDDDDHTLH